MTCCSISEISDCTSLRFPFHLSDLGVCVSFLFPFFFYFNCLLLLFEGMVRKRGGGIESRTNRRRVDSVGGFGY